jgi:hypothetical protein
LPVAAGKRATAFRAGYFTIVRRSRFYPDDLVKSIAVRALEGERLKFGHTQLYQGRSHRHMPKRDTKLVVAEGRTAEARRIVARQSELIEKLTASGQPSLEAERTLLIYISALKHLEAHEAIVRADVGARKHETKKGRCTRIRTWRKSK